MEKDASTDELSDLIIRGRESAPFRMILYGTEGVGKSTFAAYAPHPVFVQMEQGLADIDVPHTPKIPDLDNWRRAMRLIRKGKEFQTVVIDTFDVLERYVVEEILEEENNSAYKTLMDIPYGKGVPRLVPKFESILRTLEGNYNKGQNIILICHADITEFKNPDGVSYHCYTPRMHATISKLFFEWADIVGFASIAVKITEVGQGLKKRAVAVTRQNEGASLRTLQLTHSATVAAKIRYSVELPVLPGAEKTIKLDGETFFPLITSYIQGEK